MGGQSRNHWDMIGPTCAGYFGHARIAGMEAAIAGYRVWWMMVI